MAHYCLHTSLEKKSALVNNVTERKLCKWSLRKWRVVLSFKCQQRGWWWQLNARKNWPQLCSRSLTFSTSMGDFWYLPYVLMKMSCIKRAWKGMIMHIHAHSKRARVAHSYWKNPVGLRLPRLNVNVPLPVSEMYKRLNKFEISSKKVH